MALTTLELTVAPVVLITLVVVAAYLPFWLADVVGALLRARRREDAVPAARIVVRGALRTRMER